MRTENGEARRARNADLQRRAHELKPQLTGLTVAAAMARVAASDGLTLRVSANGVHTADLLPGRIEVIVRDGVIITSDDFSGRSPLYLAVFEGDLETTLTLLKEGADANAADDRKRTPLHVAAQRLRVFAIPMLIAAGAQVDALDFTGSTPLLWAVRNFEGQSDSIRALIAAGADPDIENHRGESPRQLAAANADIRIAELI